MPTRLKAHELRPDGLLLENGVWISSGSATPTHTANLGDFYFKTDGSRWRQVSSPSGTSWQQLPLSTITTSWADSGGANPGLATPSQSYELVAHAIFPGTDSIGEIQSVFATLMNEDISDSIDVKVFDVTNSLTIVEKTGIQLTTDFVFEVVDLGTISNLPASQAVFEIQIRKQGVGNPADSWISALSMEF